MKWTRALVRWIANHRFLTFLFVALLVTGGYYTQEYYRRAQGIQTQPIVNGTIADAVYGIGTVTASRILQVRPGLVSHIDRYYVKEGDQVKAGAPLVMLDNIVTRAPFAGTITSLPFKNGENVYSQSPVLTLTDLVDRYVTVSLEQQGALRVHARQKALLSFETIRETTYSGEVESVYSNDTNFLARINVKNLPARILPGMTADVAILIATHPNTLLIPVAAIADSHVWRKRGSETPVRIPIQIGIVDKEFAQLVSGDVQAGDRLVIKARSSK